MNWRARSRLNAKRTTSTTPTPQHPLTSLEMRGKWPPVSRSRSAGGAEGGKRYKDPPSVTPATPTQPPVIVHFLPCRPVFEPSLSSTHTHKNCHGVFHQLPTRRSSLRLLPQGTPPTKPQTRAHFFFKFFNYFYFFSSSRELMCALKWVAGDSSTVGRGGGRGCCRCPTGLGGEGLSWQLAQRKKFFFRKLVAWFSYLSQYIFTYLLLKWIPLQLIKKNLVNMLWIYIKKILFHADAATGELALWSNRSITLVGLKKVVCFFCFVFCFFAFFMIPGNLYLMWFYTQQWMNVLKTCKYFCKGTDAVKLREGEKTVFLWNCDIFCIIIPYRTHFAGWKSME